MNKPAELPSRTASVQTVPAWINGAPVVPGGRFGDVYNPATGEEIGRVAGASPEEVKTAVEKSREAFQAWRKTSFAERKKYFDEVQRIFAEQQPMIPTVAMKAFSAARTNLANLKPTPSHNNLLIWNLPELYFKKQLPLGILRRADEPHR